MRESEVQRVSIGPPTPADLNAPEATAGRDFLARLPETLFAELARAGRVATYLGGTVVVAPSHGPAIVISGALRYFLADRHGRQVTVRYIGPGGLVGTVIREGSDHRGSIEVLAPSVLLHLDGDQVWSLTASRPEMAEALLNDSVSRMRAAYRALGTRAFNTVPVRVARDLLDRTLVTGTLEPGARVDVTQQALADSVGYVREVVARALGQLRRHGVIAIGRGRITILDPLALRRAAGDLA